jgi:hypothetical protein
VGGKNLQQHCKMLLIYYNNVVFIIFSLNNVTDLLHQQMLNIQGLV